MRARIWAFSELAIVTLHPKPYLRLVRTCGGRALFWTMPPGTLDAMSAIEGLGMGLRVAEEAEVLCMQGQKQYVSDRGSIRLNVHAMLEAVRGPWSVLHVRKLAEKRMRNLLVDAATHDSFFLYASWRINPRELGRKLNLPTLAFPEERRRRPCDCFRVGCHACLLRRWKCQIPQPAACNPPPGCGGRKICWSPTHDTSSLSAVVWGPTMKDDQHALLHEVLLCPVSKNEERSWTDLAPFGMRDQRPPTQLWFQSIW